MYQEFCLCKKLRGVDADNEVRLRKACANELTKELTISSWLIFKSTNDEDQPIWLGRTVTKPEWQNACVWKNDTGRQQDIEGAMIPAHTFAINIQWYTQKVIGILEYIVEGGENVVPFVNSNSDLLLVVPDEHITQVIGANVRVPRRRNVRSTRMDEFEYTERENLQTTEGDWYRKEFGNMWSRLSESIHVAAIEELAKWQDK